MMNRNLYQNPQSRNSSIKKLQQNSFEVSNSQNYSFFSDEFNQNFNSNLPSPINKVDIELSHDASQEEILNYSQNHHIQEQMRSKHPSRGQSPANFQNKKNNFFASKKLSVPQGMMFNDIGTKIGWDNKHSKQSSQQFSMGFRRLNGKRTSFSKQQNQEDTEYSSCVSTGKPQQYFSQKLIQTNGNMQQKYLNLTRSYQQLERQYERIKQENIKLKNSRQELMNQNIRTKKQASYQIDNLSQEIQALKQQIYRMEMDQQSSMTNKTFTNSNMSQNNNCGYLTRDMSFYRARDNNSMSNGTLNKEINLFYVEQLEKQNDQLVRENRRLNDIIMKKLKHSIADG